MQPKLAHHPRHPRYHATHASTSPMPPMPPTLARTARHFSNSDKLEPYVITYSIAKYVYVVYVVKLRFNMWLGASSSSYYKVETGK